MNPTTSEPDQQAPEQIGSAPQPETPSQKIDGALKNLHGVHAEHGIVEMVVIAIVKGAQMPVVMVAGSDVQRAALLARFAADGLTHAAVGELVKADEGQHG